MKASDLTLDSYNSFLFKAAPGFGKTIAAASFALKGPTYIAYFDKKKPIELLTYFTEKRFGKRAKTIMDNIEYDVYGAHNAHDYLNKLIRLTESCRYVNFITDSVTNLTASAVNWSMGFRDPKAGKKDKINKEAPQLIPDWDEYKVETSLVSQALDLCKSLPCNVIWIAHPLPGLKLEGSGASVKVTKVNPIVTYGSKVAGMVPGSFTEIYHFSQASDWNAATGTSKKKFICNLDAIGDDFAKSPLFEGSGIKEIDYTDQLFYEVWKAKLDEHNANITAKPLPVDITNPTEATTSVTNPFATQQSDKQNKYPWEQ